jgi:hypothetical protein
MKREFIPFELSVKLKALEFDEPCFGYYVDGELRGINLGIEELGGIEPYYQIFGFHTLSNHNIDNPNKIVVTAPTYSQALRWFREKYNIHSFIIPLIDEVGFVYKYQARVHTKESAVEIIGEFETYEEAEIACLENLIELVESKSE